MLFLMYLLFVITYFLSSYACFIIDMTYPNTRIDNLHPNKSLILYQKYLPKVAFNVFVLPIPFFYLISTNFPILYRSLTLYNFIVEIILTYFLTDIIVYIFHRILHSQYFYRNIHYIHHLVRNPIGFSALYAHPLDVYLGNLIPLFLPAYFIMTNIVTFCVWIIIITIDIVTTSHSSYKGISEFYNNHYMLYGCNYGLDIFMDILFRTRI